MFRKLFILYAIAAFGSAIVFAQTPSPRASVTTGFFLGDGGYLGVETVEVTKDNFSKFGLRDVRGVAIEKVIADSPAAAAGLQAGDVIVAFNGDEITSSRKLTRLMSEVSPDHSVKLIVLRGGLEREITATAGKRPVPKFEGGNFRMNFPNVQVPDMSNMPDVPLTLNLPRRIPNFPNQDRVWTFGPSRVIGVGITPLSKQLAAHFGVEAGVIIDEVRENSPASKAGLKAGDIIVEIEGKAVRRDGDILLTLSEKKEGDVSLTIVRNGNRQTVKVTPEEFKGGFNFESPMPRSPGKVNVVPATPGMAPMPLDQFIVRGRII